MHVLVDFLLMDPFDANSLCLPMTTFSHSLYTSAYMLQIRNLEKQLFQVRNPTL